MSKLVLSDLNCFLLHDCHLCCMYDIIYHLQRQHVNTFKSANEVSRTKFTENIKSKLFILLVTYQVLALA